MSSNELMMKACQEGNLDKLKRAVKNGANVNSISMLPYVIGLGHTMVTAVHYVLGGRDYHLLEVLIMGGLKLDFDAFELLERHTEEPAYNSVDWKRAKEKLEDRNQCMRVLIRNGYRYRGDDYWMKFYQSNVVLCVKNCIRLLALKRRRIPSMSHLDRFLVQALVLELWRSR